MWEEIQYAEGVSTLRLNELFTARQLFEMASSIPARVARIDDKVGTLAAGMLADFFLVKQPAIESVTAPYDAILAPYDSVLSDKIGAIDLVVIDGTPVYGDPAMLKSLNIPTEPLHLCGTEKALNSDALPNGSFAAVEARLSSKLKVLGTELGPLDSCPQ